MPAIVEHHFDFGSPNCYLAHRVIPAIEDRTGARFDYVPILLGAIFKATNNQPPMVAFRDIPNKMDYMRIEMGRFIKKHGITAFRMNPHFPVNTVQVMRGAVAAQETGDLPAYTEAVFAAMWEAGEKMDDPEVIGSVLDNAGLDAGSLMRRIGDQSIKDKLRETTEASVARGTFGAPTFYVGDEIYFGKDSLRDVEEAVAGA